MAALLLFHILTVFSVVAPGQPGAALRDLCHAPRFQGTSRRDGGGPARQHSTRGRSGSILLVPRLFLDLLVRVIEHWLAAADTIALLAGS
jgi:hypothetical protein